MLPVSYAKRLHLYLQGRAYGDLYRHFLFGDNEAPGASARNLLNLLARFFAYGATFDADKKMPRPQYVEELVVDVLPVEVPHLQFKHDHDEPGNDPDREMLESLGCFGMVARSGLLFGRLGRISAYVDGKFRQQWEVVYRENTEETVKEWSRALSPNRSRDSFGTKKTGGGVYEGSPERETTPSRGRDPPQSQVSLQYVKGSARY
ncbi:MAG: hypothetical protein Q9208_001442 [Pyrenodesmia sp. 3 TL-2023]